MRITYTVKCPHCNNEIPETAVRCRHCRKAVRVETISLSEIFNKAKNVLINILSEGKDPSCRWSFFDALLITALIALFIFRDPFNLGKNIIDFLRLRFFIFTKEPKLLYYLTIYINTIILKFFCLFSIIALVKLRRASFWNSVVFSGKPPAFTTWFLAYIGICVVFRLVNMANPLAPNIPLDSVFVKAFVIGNLVMIFSIVFVAPFVEEILFRGFLYPIFNKYTGIYPSIILTSVLFTAAHYPHIKSEFVYIITLFILSVVVTYARAKTGSTWLAIIMHHVYNLVYVLLGVIKYAIVKY